MSESLASFNGAVLYSVLTFDELAYRMLLALIRDQYSGSPLEQLRDNEESYCIHTISSAVQYITQRPAVTH